MSHHFERKLRCPICSETIERTVDPKVFGLDMPLAEPEPGDLTQCEGCHAFLEYSGSDRRSLTLRLARPGRMKLFRKLSQENPDELKLPDVIAYVRRYRQMPLPDSKGNLMSLREFHQHRGRGKAQATKSDTRESQHENATSKYIRYR